MTGAISKMDYGISMYALGVIEGVEVLMGKEM